MTDSTSSDHTIIVGVGASAGSLEAFQKLLKGLPEQHNLVLVLIQHLDPDHESLMPELLSAKTKSPVQSVTDGIEVQKGHIYLMPPGFEMEIQGRQLRLIEFDSPRGLRRPIDRFLNSLAVEHGENAAAVVLSGTGSGGASGARELKGHGGLVLVQDPREATYDGMPQSVLDQGSADVTARADEIIDVVRDYFSFRIDRKGAFGSETEFLDRILRHVRFRTGHDFAEYKEATMLRRVAVRMSVLNLTSPNEYLKLIVDNKQEADLLFRDLLINVTSFFRDPEHFETLKRQVIPDLVDSAEEHGELRVWVAGCSTGEEAYSVGMLIAEELSRVNKQCKVVIFGTDIDERALQTARQGRYPDIISDTLPRALLDNYFKPLKEGYEVGEVLREMVRFSRHSFIKDPPFSKLDMVTCRNVLIYLKDSLQELTCRVFHYALRTDGYLFLGPSENPQAIAEFFAESASHARIFRRKPGQAKPQNLGGLSGAVLDRPEANGATGVEKTEIERAILDFYAPAYLHVDDNNNVIFVSENASRYLAVRGGTLTTNLFELVAPELEAAFRRVARIEAPPNSSREFDFQGEIRGEEQRLLISTRKLGDASQLFVIKDNLELIRSRQSESKTFLEPEESYVTQLEVELDSARQEVRTTVEELETSNEELKSSNEQMMSMNEELQSANEELKTINDELQEKLRELNQANVDLNNFVQSARVPTVFLDANLCLFKYTPEATDFFSFTDKDIGRSMHDLNARIDQNRLFELCAITIDDQQEREEEFRSKDGKISMAVRIMPYSPDGLQSRGVVFTLQDVTELRNELQSARDATKIAEERREEVEQIYKLSPIAMGLIDRDMKYLRLNRKLAEINGVPVEHHFNRTIRQVIPAVADHTEALVRQVIETEKPILGERVTGTTRGEPENERVWESDWMPFYTGSELTAVSVTVRDVTDQVQISENLREIMGELEHRVKNMLSNVTALVNRGAREATADKAVFATLTKRIQGLANTHALLTSEAWSSALIRDIVLPETAQIYGEDRVTLSGPNVRVTSEATLAIGMAIHELATNAAKYGASSVDDGHVDLSWSRVNDATGDRLILRWSESGGPEVTLPERKGFGSQLIRSTIEGNLSGKVEMSWEPSGLRVVLGMGFEEATGKVS